MTVFPVPPQSAKTAWISAEDYSAMYARSLRDPDSFWREHGRALEWIKPYTKVKQGDFSGDARVSWFEDGTLNVSSNCLDRHLATRGDQTAIIWEPDDPAHTAKQITYRELYEQTCAMANILKKHGVVKGDRVIIYLPMIPEAAVAMLACARIGAIHSVVFAGFSPNSLRDRILDCGAKLVITADEGRRGGRIVPLKINMDEALLQCPSVTTVLAIRHTGSTVPWQTPRDYWLHDEKATVDTQCPPAEMGSEDPLFILYTSGSTGTPKGVLHTTGGYLLHTMLSHKWVLDIMTAIFIGAGPISAGSQATVISSMVLWPMAQQRSCSKGYPIIPIRRASGKSSTNTVSHCFIRHRRLSAP